MADDGNVTTASTALGTIGTVFWCVQLIPQIWYNWRHKKTEGFPALMAFLWAGCMFYFSRWTLLAMGVGVNVLCLGAVPMGVYLILQVSIPNLPTRIERGITQ